MDIITRAAKPADAADMCALLNAIIEKGGTTAHRGHFDVDRMMASYVNHPKRITCTVALRGDELLGFQGLDWLEGRQGWGGIASFVAIAGQGLGVGHAMFKRTLAEARAAGVSAIDATIRLENTGGRKFYASLGFVDYQSSEEAVSKKFEIAQQ